MKILLINHYAGSTQHGMEFRPYYMAREWVDAGNEVHIVAAGFTHLRRTNPDLAGRRFYTEKISGINYHWLSVPQYKGNGLKRILNILTFVYGLSRSAKNLARIIHPDVVIASSTYPMDIWPAYYIANKVDAQLIFEIHDLWPLSPMQLGGYSPNHPYIRLVQAAEDFAFSKSDAIVSILPNVEGYIRERGFGVESLHVVPNGVDPTSVQPDEPQPDELADIEGLLRELKREDYFIIGYAGAHGVPNALGSLLDAISAFENEKVACVLVGDGSEKESLIAKTKQLPVARFVFFDPVSKRDMPRVLSLFDIGYIGLRTQPLFKYGISPNKIWDYMLAGLPILKAVDAGNDPVSDARCGVSVEPEDPADIARGIQLFRDMRRDERVAMGELGRKFVLENHTYPVLASKFASIFKTKERE